jgi:Avidin family
MASWKGTWRNQYGSIVVIEDDTDGVIRGVFRTALEDSSFFGLEAPIHGAAYGNVIGFTAASNGKAGPVAVSYTGLLRDGKLETLWHTVADQALTAAEEGAPARLMRVGTWRAFGTSLDAFERIRTN